MCHARQAGGDHLLGWGTDRQIMASMYNLLSFQTKVTGNWKKKPPKLPTIDKPKKPVDKSKKKRVTVMDLYRKFQGMSSGR